MPILNHLVIVVVSVMRSGEGKMDSTDINNTILMHYKIQKRIIELQDRLIGILESGHKDPQLIESIKTSIDEFEGILK